MALLEAKSRTPPDKFPTNFDYDVTSDGASAKIKDVSQKLASAFEAGNAAAAAALFSYDAVYADRALRSLVLGRQAIGAYLARILPTVPYGKSVKLMHVVGSDQGGGFEWTNNGSSVKRGVVAIDLDGVADAIISVTTPVTVALVRETQTIPILLATVADPISSGLAKKLTKKTKKMMMKANKKEKASNTKVDRRNASLPSPFST